MSWTNICGFEIPDGVELYGGAGWSIQNSVKYGGKNYTGKYALRLNGSGAHWVTLGKNYGYSHVLFNAGSFVDNPYISFRFLCAALPSADQRFAAILYASGTKMHLKLATDGKIKAYDSAGTLKGTSTKQVPTNTWVTIQMYCTSSATVGRIIVRMAILGQSVSTEIDDSTCNTTTSQHTLCELGNTNFGESVDYYYDDCYFITDTWTSPTISVAALFPNAAGDYSGWTGAYTDVDDYLYASANDGDTTTENTATASARFSVNMQSPVQAGISNYSGGNVWGVHWMRASSSCDCQFYIDSTGTGLMGSQSVAVGTAYKMYGMCWGSGGGTNIDNLRVGAIKTDSRNRTLYDTAVWATITLDNPTLGTVEYTPTGGPMVSSPKGTYSKQLQWKVVADGPKVVGYSYRYHGLPAACGYNGVLADWMAGLDPNNTAGQYAWTGSGYIRIEGAATKAKEKGYSGTGFIRITGTATVCHIKVYQTTGAAWAVGAGTIEKLKIATGSGSVWTDGTAPVMAMGTRFYTGSGFIRIVGSVTGIKEKVASVAGAYWVGGAAVVQKDQYYLESGGFWAVGTLIRARVFAPQISGMFRAVGSVIGTKLWVRGGTGAVFAGGTAPVCRVVAPQTSGEFKAVGDAEHYPCRVYTATVSGGIWIVGTANYYACREWVRTGTAVTYVAGAALVSKNFYIASGYFRAVGHAVSRYAFEQPKQGKARHVHSRTWMFSKNAGRLALTNRRPM